MLSSKYDFIIVGAGVVGLNIARELLLRNKSSKILIIDKEKKIASHSSGRNSGVLHAGFYYTADSLKAQFTRNGCEYLTDYCLTMGLSINRCGKLVVTKDESELPSLNELFKRAKNNGVELIEMDEFEAQKIEPRVKTFKKAAWSPKTATVDPVEVMNSFMNELIKSGVEFLFEAEYWSCQNNLLKTSKGQVEFGYLINSAGLYADQIAKDHGLSKKYTILPFKGLYLYCTNDSKKFNTHIYPVPNLKNPFLGVHHTLTVDGHTKVGPTAIPAFWREQYNGFDNFDLSEAIDIITQEIGLFFKGGFDFRSLALEEVKKYSRKYLIGESQKMATDVDFTDYTKWGKPGIRAQLLNTETKKLEMDFIVEQNSYSIHVLNAVSPAFTASKPFAEYIVSKI